MRWAGHEHVAGDQAVAAGRLHPGHEPGLLQVQVGPRDQGQALVDDLAGLVGEGDAEHRPVGVPGPGVPVPPAGDLVPAVHLAGLGGRREHAGDQRVRVVLPHVVLGLPGVGADHPGAHVQQRDHPPGAAVGLADRGRHVEHGAHRGLVAAVPPGLGDPQDARLLQRPHALLGHPPVRLPRGGVRAQERMQFGHPGDELGRVRHGGPVIGRSGHGVSFSGSARGDEVGDAGAGAFGEPRVRAEGPVGVDQRGQVRPAAGRGDQPEQQQVVARFDAAVQLADHPAGRVGQPGQPVIGEPVRRGEPVGAAAGEGHRQLVLGLAEDVDTEPAGRLDLAQQRGAAVERHADQRRVQ